MNEMMIMIFFQKVSNEYFSNIFFFERNVQRMVRACSTTLYGQLSHYQQSLMKSIGSQNVCGVPI